MASTRREPRESVGHEWLKVVWPSSCIGGGGAKAAAAAADTIRRAIAAQAGGAPLPKDPRLEPRALVWLRNRHPEHAKGQAPVFRPILAGETPYEKVRIAASLLYFDVACLSSRRWRRAPTPDAIDRVAATGHHIRHRRDTMTAPTSTPSTRHRDTKSTRRPRAGPHAGGIQTHAAQRRGAQGGPREAEPAPEVDYI